MKYIDIQTAEKDKYLVWACRDGTKTAILLSGGKLVFDQRAVGMRVEKNYQPPKGLPALFSHEEAISVAHQIGRYVFGLGDLVYAYTTVDGYQDNSFFDTPR